MPNLTFISEHGIIEFMEQQRQRIAMLETMIERFNDGRSRSFYCQAAALLDATSLRGALAEADRKVRADKVRQNDWGTKAKILRTILQAEAL